MHGGVRAGDAPGLLHVVGDAVDLGAPARVVAERFGAGGHDGVRLLVGHAGVQRVDLGEFISMLVDEIGYAPQDFGAFVSGQPAPGTALDAGASLGDGFLDGRGTAVGEFGDLLLGRRD